MRSVPLCRLYSSSGTNHFYTTSRDEALTAASALGYTMEHPPCNVFTQQYERTVPLYRLYNDALVDHFYTTDAAERNSAVKNLQYVFEDVVGYVFPPDGECGGGRPLYRLFSQGARDHFYTSDAAERDRAMTGGYVDEGIAAYAPRATE